MFISKLTYLLILVIHVLYTNFVDFDLVNVLNHSSLIGLGISGFKVNSVCLLELSRNLPQLQALRDEYLGKSKEPYIVEAVLLSCNCLKPI